MKAVENPWDVGDYGSNLTSPAKKKSKSVHTDGVSVINSTLSGKQQVKKYSKPKFPPHAPYLIEKTANLLVLS